MPPATEAPGATAAAPPVAAAPPPNPAGTPSADLSKPTTVTEPKPGSARARMFEDFGKYIKKGSEDPAAAPAPPAAPAAKPEDGAPPDPATAPPDPKAQADVEPPAQPPATDKKPKVSPWKLVDEWKAKAAAAEAQVLELQKSVVPPAKVEELNQRLTQAEARAKAAEDELRFADYQKHPEFKTKFEEPYVQSWHRAVKDLKGILVKDMASGSERPFAADDIAALTQLELGPARKLANEMFGEFADDAMAHRKEIITLFEAKESALKQAREGAGERDKQRQEQFKTFQEGLKKQVGEFWQAANDAISKDPVMGKWSSPVEGDAELNARLAKGFEIVDAALKANPFDPKLTPEQRASVIKKHTAMRHRAAAFGRLVLERSRLEAKVTELQAQLDKYQKSIPVTGGGRQGGGAAAPKGAREEMMEHLGKLAH